MKVSLFAGDITLLAADAICTSTNPRLSLVSGSGGAVRERGGWEIKRACEAILARAQHETGRRLLPLGSVHLTTAGALPARGAIHCVASNAFHRSSEDLIRACVHRSLARAATEGWRTVAMPVFGAGHAAFPFDRALAAIAGALRDAPAEIEEVTIAVLDRDRVEEALRIVRTAWPEARVTETASSS
jgi:O-acetyl-ADP-ribose deacetylase (regulator of RNase III)